MKQLIFVLFFVAWASSSFAQWTLKEKDLVNFTIDGPLGIDVDGTMQISSWKLIFEPSLNASFEVEIILNAASVFTGNSKRDKHIKDAPYFEVGKYPRIEFKSKNVKQGLKGAFLLEGDLKMKETTQKISIPFSFTYKGNDGFIAGTVTINRLDYNIGGKSLGMGNDVKIKIELPVKRANP
jgi:polyisoprenoid-binding protein YceI